MKGPSVEVIASTVCARKPFRSPHRGDQDQGSEMARLIEFAGRACYNSYDKGRDSAAFHAHLRAVDHLSVIEHASLSFHISGISRGCSHELVRHRVGVAISQRSTRYVDESESEWCWHPALLKIWIQEEGVAAFQQQARALYRGLVEKLEPKVGRKQARGAARGVLGNALSTELVYTCNLRALRHIIALRATDAADAEIRLLAVAMHAAALPYCPEWLSDFEEYPAVDGIGVCLRSKDGRQD